MNAFMAPVHLSATINKAASIENRLMAQCDDLVSQWENLPAGTDARDFIEYEADEIMDLVIGGAWVGALLTLTYGGQTITLDTYEGKIEASSHGTTVTRTVVVDADILDELESRFSDTIA